MKKTKFLKTCNEYDELLEKEGFLIKLKEPFVLFENGDLDHLRWMLNQIPSMIDDPRKLEKVNRWIGFIQGVLWCKGYCTIEDMRGQSGDVEITETFYYQFEGGISNISLD